MRALVRVDKLAVVYLAVALLVLDPRNPRRHSARQIKQIANSILAFGFNVPILANGANRVVAGHGRVLAAKQLNMKEVPVVRLEHLTEAQVRAFNIADNRLTENATWDDQLLAESLRELSILDLDFSLEATGFDMGEIDIRIEGLSSKAGESNDQEAEPAPPGGPPATKLGDLWLLGGHRVYCGSALEQHDFYVLMDNTVARMVFIDPPYNVRIDGHVSGLGAIHHREFAMAAGEMSSPQYVSFLGQNLTLLARHCVDGSILFSCIDWRHLAEMLAAGSAAGLALKNICVWVKHNAGMGSLYRSQYENVVVFKNGRAPHRNNIELGRHGRHRSNVWDYPAINNFGRATDEGHLLALHPTVKPVRLVADAILDCSARGDIVLDSFLGSGTTLIAAERTGRRCYGMELDPLYVDTAIRRWEAYTGQFAVHAVTGQRFGDAPLALGGHNG